MRYNLLFKNKNLSVVSYTSGQTDVGGSSCTIAASGDMGGSYYYLNPTISYNKYKMSGLTGKTLIISVYTWVSSNYWGDHYTKFNFNYLIKNNSLEYQNTTTNNASTSKGSYINIWGSRYAHDITYINNYIEYSIS